MTWYFIAGAEAVASVAISNLSAAASLTPTHMMRRMSLLTVMFLGEGIQQLAKEVVTIVKTPGAWGKSNGCLEVSVWKRPLTIISRFFDH